MHSSTLRPSQLSISAVPRERSQGRLRTQLSWFASGSILSFVIPYVFTSLISINHDLYYAIYFAAVLGFLAAYAATTQLDIAALFRDNWRWSLGLGALSTAFVVANVLSRDSTPGPSGAYAVFEVGWRGVAYGVVDALLLTAFPTAVALSILGRRLSGLGDRLRAGVLILPMVLVITGVYHLGYDQFREDGIGPPEIGNTVMSLPAIATGNPLGTVIAHSSMHVTADIHSYETDVFLPPQTDAPDD